MKTNYIIALIIAWGSMAFQPSYAQKVVIKDGYTAISAEGYTQGVKSDASTIFEDVALGSLDSDQKVKRVKRHNTTEDIQISPLFIIAPTYIDASGEPVYVKTGMFWATAGGWTENANTTNSDTPQFAEQTGCPQYKGKDGTDNSGIWRLPTHKELHLINQLLKALNKTNDQTGFQPLDPFYGVHWSSTEEISVNSARGVSMTGSANLGSGTKGVSKYVVRCIKDLPVK